MFWKEVANGSDLTAGFSPQSIGRMRSGDSLFVAKEQRHGGGKNLVLHHVQPIQHGGGVYDMDNLLLSHPSITPRSSIRAIITGMAKRYLDEAGRERALQLIRQLRDPRLPDEASGPLFDELERLLVYPRVVNLMFFEDPELSDEEVVERALEYKPFEL